MAIYSVFFSVLAHSVVPRLKLVDDGNANYEEEDGNENAYENLPPGQWQRQNDAGKDEEDQEEIHQREPTIISCVRVSVCDY